MRDTRVLSQSLKYGISCCSNTTLQGEELWRNMSTFHVVNKKFCNVISHLTCLWGKILETTSLFWNVAIHNAHNLLWVNLYIVFSYSVATVHDREGSSAKSTFKRFKAVVKEMSICIVEVIKFKNHLFSQSCNSCCNTACRCEACFA